MVMQNKEAVRKFGTFEGVYVPTILTILGVIMYLRLGWIVGNAGLLSSLAILAIAESITILTAFSLAAISTNMEIKGGGAYYLISRSLGIEIGGSIGLPLFISQTFGIGFYIVGFSETFCTLLPGYDIRIVGIVVLIILTVIALISSTLAIKTQYIVLFIILLSLISLLLGGSIDPDKVILTESYTAKYSFWTVFAVFFPAVTGMEAGLSMSGDLKNPKKNLPLGTISAVFTGVLVYGGLIIWFSSVSDRTELIENKSIVIQLAKWPPIVIAGILAATLSSALASIMAAPRTLQALSKDKILPTFFKGNNDSLTIATFTSFLIAGAVIFMGELNAIAPILTMFFLITYGSINFIAGLEKVIGLPSYRPSFNVHWFFSFLGAIGAVWVMIVINFWACIIGFLFVISIYIYLKRRNFKNDWGDARRGFWQSIVQYSLGKLEQTTEHPKNWRPNILIFAKVKQSGSQLLNIANALSKGHGLITMIHIIDIDEKNSESDFQAEREKLSAFMKNNKIDAFMNMAMTDDNLEAQLITSQVHGIGNYKPNTILMEWGENKKLWFLSRDSEMSRQMKLLKFYKTMSKSIILLHLNQSNFFGRRKKIHMWWDPTQENGSFMLLLAYLISTSEQWEDSKIYLKSVVMPEHKDETKKILITLLQKSRIKAWVDVYTPERDDSTESEFISFVSPGKFKSVLKKIRQRWKSDFDESVSGNNTTLDNSEKNNIETQNNDNYTKDIEQKADSTLRDTHHTEELISKQVDSEDREYIEEKIDSIIVENSKDADIVILGFNVPQSGNTHSYVKRMDELLEKLPTTLLVNSGFDVDLYS